MSLPYILAYSGVPLEWRVQREDLPKVAYVIVASIGEYSDRMEWPLVVFLDKEKAQEEMAKLEKISEEYQKREGSNQARTAVSKYAALGYDELSGAEYWELHESKVKF